MTKRFNRIHVICEYLHEHWKTDFKCKRCPAWERSEHHGKVQRGCYGIAEEVSNIARTGNPWGKPMNSASGRHYRQRIVKRFKKGSREG